MSLRVGWSGESYRYVLKGRWSGESYRYVLKGGCVEGCPSSPVMLCSQLASSPGSQIFN